MKAFFQPGNDRPTLMSTRTLTKPRFELLPVLAGLLILGPLDASAFHAPPAPELPNFDRRAAGAAATAALEHRAALSRLHERLPEARVDFNDRLGTPAWITASRGYLTGPGGAGRAVSSQAAAAFASDDPYRATKAFLQDHKELFGFGAEALAEARISREFVTAHNGLRTVVWQQQVDDIPVFEGLLISHTTRTGELVSVSSHFVPAPALAADAGTPNRAAMQAKPAVSAGEAVALAAENLGQRISADQVTTGQPTPEGAVLRHRFKGPGINNTAETTLVWLPLNRNALRLCWQVVLTVNARAECYKLLIDTTTGKPLVRHCLTDYLTSATYRVYTSDSPSPFSPGWPTPNTNQPPLQARALVTLSALDTTASPQGWIDDADNETRGNNVDAHADLDADLAPDLPRPQGSPWRVFDFPLDLAQDPITYTNAAVVQLFYWCNWMHDKLYELGFTEAAGNFQNSNFGRGGVENDAVQANAQEGSPNLFNNAKFNTDPEDGTRALLMVGVYKGPKPNRDADLSAEIILHEYTHGLSKRRVGGGGGLSALQSQALSEGWSDFCSLAFLSESTDDLNGTYAHAAYNAFLVATNFMQNYYFGIRRYPYSTDMARNPLTFKDIDPGQASSHTGVPLSPLIGTVIDANADEFHNMGEVWCVTLWDMRANLIKRHGFAAGNQLALQLVVDGMNHAPPNPNFVQARDAILESDRVSYGEANYAELWDAFAKRGLGAAATSPASDTASGVREDFRLPVHDTIYVNWAYGGDNSDGSAARPFPTVAQANQVARPLDLIIIQAGSYPEALTFSTRMTVQSQGGAATIGP